MPDSDLIPVVHVPSGKKFVNEQGITAIKDGIKTARTDGKRLRKPDWLRIRVRGVRRSWAILSETVLTPCIKDCV